MRTLVAVVPGTAGHIGAVTVNPGPQQVLLDRAYAAASVEAGQPPAARTLDADEVERRFGAARAARPQPPATFVVHFVLGTSELTAESKATLEQVLAEMSRRPGADVTVVGHTDRRGTTAGNDALSLRRAQRVRDYMTAHGFDGELIGAMGRGERDASTADDDPDQRSVEVIVR
ncbi:MAG TPA: OmpA family protein [Candidatus Binatia bacterium]|nr:OmpA family protein [Candidatus Binatia bacterium]